MTADICDALATHMADEMSVPVYYPSLPRSIVEGRSSERIKALVITPGGSLSFEGDASYSGFMRARVDFRAYGETDYQAMKVYREADAILRGLTPRVVNCGPEGEEVGVRLFNAVLANGPIQIVDPDIKEEVQFATWGLTGHATEVAAAP